MLPSPVDGALYAIGALNTANDVRADNLANLNTPNYTARQVDFTGQLAAAVGRGDPGAAAAPRVVAAPLTPDARNNTVYLNHEMTQMMRDELFRNAAVTGYNHQVSQLRTALGG